MKAYRNMLRRQMAGFTLVEIMIVVLIIGILLAIAIPNFMQARESARARSCVANLKQIDSAKQQWMMDNKSATITSETIAPGATTDGTLNLVGTYLRSVPQCPESGTYTTNTAAAFPICLTGGVITGSTNTPSTPHELT